MVRIAIVNSKSFGVYTDAVERLKQIGHVERVEVPKDARGKDLAERLAGYHIIVASVTPTYDREFFEHDRDVLLIVRHGIGYDNIDVRAAEEHGVYVARVPGWREREAVAEHAVALLLSALRHIVSSHEAVRQGKWHERARYVGRELSSLTVGVVGFGNIGSRVAEILSKGFGSRIVVYDPYVGREEVERRGYVYAEKLEDLVELSDVITIHAAYTGENYHMFNEEIFEKMRRGAIIVNTARGELIDTTALCKYLEKGVVAAAALDVVEGEPIDADHVLLKYPNVILTPHIAAYTYEALAGMDEAVVKAIVSYLQGKPIDGVVVAPRYPRKLESLRTNPLARS